MAVDLGTLGKSEGFLERQGEGWARHADAAHEGAAPDDVSAIVAWLPTHVPTEPTIASLLHCDLKLDNMLIDPGTLTLVAIVDWDRTTRGDPRFDLAVLLSYWIDHDTRPPCML